MACEPTNKITGQTDNSNNTTPNNLTPNNQQLELTKDKIKMALPQLFNNCSTQIDGAATVGLHTNNQGNGTGGGASSSSNTSCIRA